MKLLVVGGSIFVGRHIVEDALTRGWDVTMVTRGRHAIPKAFVTVRQIVGDRRSVVGNLVGTWDAVIDTCGYRPEDVRSSVASLEGRIGCYVFISSASVYPKGIEVGSEEFELVAPSDTSSMDPELALDYGPLKAACERAVLAGKQDALILRPGLVVGPYDPTDRFGYWPQRMALGSVVLAPGSPDDYVQVIDGRDHAAFVARCLLDGVTGTFNVSSDPMPMSEVLNACTPTASEVTIRWIDSRLLRLNQVQPWTELPLWQGLKPGPMISNMRARAAGLAIRPLAVTAADTLAWERTRGGPFPRLSQLSMQRESELLKRYG
jgi:2'-hydroxyisoflavone reductase